MNVVKFDDKVELLKPLVQEWADTINKEEFNLACDVDRYLDVLDEVSRNGLVAVLVDFDKIVGFIMIDMVTSLIGYQTIAIERSWYVSPDYRGTSSLRLIKYAVMWAKEHECSHIILNASCLASDMYDKVCELYERLGMKKFDTGYISSL